MFAQQGKRRCCNCSEARGIPTVAIANRVTNANFKAHIVTRSVGPFRVTGFDKAVESLTGVMTEIKAERPEIHEALGSARVLWARFVRGSEV